ncbi:MAG TPA: hypothetical protein VJZ02_07530 [Candidatus Brocadiales bacterium]|nr:hypothetical protein [Candidatus Brocadiales bacterium]
MSMSPRVFLISLFALMIGIALAASPSDLLAKKNMPTPDDFSIFLHSAGRLPGSPEYAIRIGPDGHGKNYEKPEGMGKELVLVSEFDLDATAMKKIYDVIKKEKFFDLKQEYRDPNIMDGDFAEMEITADGKKHRVTTVNIKVDAFDNIVREINTHTPQKASIYYNALLVDDYKRVER